MVGTFFLSVSFADERELLDFLRVFPIDRRILKLRVFFPLASWRSIYSIFGASLTPNGWWMEFEIPDEATLMSFLSELSMLEPIGYSITLSVSFDNFQSFEKIVQEFYEVENIRRLETIEQEGF